MKISIITVSLNAAETIEQTMVSVLNQNCRSEVEYIIIDGGSTDGTMQIVGRYADRLSRVVSESDRGLYDAMNKGIRLATGDVIGILNADDCYFPGAFRCVEDAFADCDCSDVIFWGDVEYEHSGRVKGFRPWNRYIGAFAPHPSMFCPKKVYDRIGLYDDRMKFLGDYDFMYRAVNFHHIKVVYRPEMIAFFREGGLADSHIKECLADELAVKLRYGQLACWAKLIYHLKLWKNHSRIKRNIEN